MRSLQRFIYLLVAFTLSNACVFASGEDSLGIRKKADSLAHAGEHHLAYILYAKALYFEEEPSARGELAIKAGGQLKELHRFGDAAELIGAVSAESLPDTMVFDLKYRAAVLSYLDADFASCENYLVQVSYLLHDSALIGDTYLLHALALNEQYRWSEAKEKLRLLVKADSRENSGEKKLHLLDSLYDPAEIPKIKSKSKALRMSSFVPGLGQTYAGYPAEGAFSLGALLVTSGAMVFGIVNQYYFTSIVLGNMLIGKFYQGGLSRTEYLVDKRNYLKAKKFNELLKKALVREFGT